ncbi:reticulon-2 isoform X2 [Hyla sarda]|uniref:reticulon-2 isoform X2 n=1 Tax=Hyla sarda TaxID=327740 RepID=UPI0024C4279E|nr:reticulon-2 isoform X2 [Hyla sarda]
MTLRWYQALGGGGLYAWTRRMVAKLASTAKDKKKRTNSALRTRTQKMASCWLLCDPRRGLDSMSPPAASPPEDAPSTASSTPDSCPPDGDLDDDTVTPADLWPLPSPQEPTFSYITIGSSVPLPRPTVRARKGRGLGRGLLPRKEEPEEETVTFVLLEKACQITQDLPLRNYEEQTLVEKPQPRVSGITMDVGRRDSHHLLPQSRSSYQEETMRKAVADLLYWRDITLSTGCLTGITLCLLCLIQFSVISVLSYACLLILCAAFTMRLYYKLLKKGDGGNPFQKYLDMEPILPPQQVEVVASRLVVLFFAALSTLRRLFLVQDTKESLKFLLLLYLLTYVGAVVNGLTLLLLGVIGVFTFPVLYKHNQALVDRYVSMVTGRFASFRAKFRAQLRKQGSKKD